MEIIEQEEDVGSEVSDSGDSTSNIEPKIYELSCRGGLEGKLVLTYTSVEAAIHLLQVALKRQKSGGLYGGK